MDFRFKAPNFPFTTPNSDLRLRAPFNLQLSFRTSTFSTTTGPEPFFRTNISSFTQHTSSTSNISNYFPAHRRNTTETGTSSSTNVPTPRNSAVSISQLFNSSFATTSNNNATGSSETNNIIPTFPTPSFSATFKPSTRGSSRSRARAVSKPAGVGSVICGIGAVPTISSVSNVADKNTIMAIVEGRGQARGEVGIACMELNRPNVTLCQFSDTQTYAKLIAKINIFRPFEILLPSTMCIGSGTQMFKQLEKEVPYSTIIPLQRRLFNESKGLSVIQALVAEGYGTILRVVTYKYYCVAAVAALLKYAELFQNIIFAPKSLKIEFQVAEKSCLIDSVTARHLELLVNNQYQNSTHSLLGIVNTCRTPLGARLLRMNILQPPCDASFINNRLDCVEELMNNSALIDNIQRSLSRLPVDVDQVIATLVQIPKVDNERLLEQRINYIIGLKHTLELLPIFLSDLENVENDYMKTFRKAFDKPVYATILSQIGGVLNEEVHVQKGSSNMKRQRCFAVKSGINAILDVGRQVYCEIINDMNGYVTRLSEEHNLALRLIENNSRGYYIQHTLSGRGDTLPKLPSEFLQVRKQRNVISFTTESLLTFDQRSRDVIKEIQKISSMVVAELVVGIRGHIGSLYDVSEAVANLDLLCSLAHYSLILGARGTRPKFSSTVTSITNGSHPILYSISEHPIVPNSTLFSQDANFMLLTGANMSGKTTYLKQVAILQILSQLGCFIPAEGATIRVVNTLFSRIGTGDRLESNSSTFAIEMTEMDYILMNLSDNCLVIVDELGRATSVEEGTCISWAMAEALMKTKAFVLFATHYLFLTKLESLYLNVLNYKMETKETEIELGEGENGAAQSDRCKLKNTHTIQRGITNIEHYGLKLTRNSSYPKVVVDEATNIAEGIIRLRKNATKDEEKELQPTKRSLLLLASQLELATTLKTNDKESLRNYLQNLREEFVKTVCLSSEDEDEDAN